jgi:hypothetical protein
MENLVREITHEQLDNVLHGQVEVPPDRNPFQNNRREHEFFKVLDHVVQQRILLVGYGILPEEWEDGSYPITEELNVGRRRKSISISLADDVWLECARLWVQRLNVLAHFLQ